MLHKIYTKQRVFVCWCSAGPNFVVQASSTGVARALPLPQPSEDIEAVRRKPSGVGQATCKLREAFAEIVVQASRLLDFAVGLGYRSSPVDVFHKQGYIDWVLNCTVGVAQLVRVPDCGSGGRGFKSRHSPLSK